MRVPVTVIIPCYRSANTIARAVGSVATQTLPPEEILLVDDCSNDGDATLNVLRRLPQTFPQANLRIIALEKNTGPGEARNAGWETASQPWLAFLDADDAWHPRKLEIQWHWIESHQDAVLCGHDSRFSAGETNYPAKSSPKALRLSLLQMLISNRLPTRSVMLRRDLPFRFSNMRGAEDYQLWLEIIFAGYPAYRIESLLAYSFRAEFSPGGVSGQLWEHEKCELAALNTLRGKGYLSWPELALWASWSFMKFLRRLWLRRGAQ